MKSIFLKLSIPIMICIMLSGCGSKKDVQAGSLYLAKNVFVDCRYYENQLSRTYHDSDKIDVILRYLHQIDTKSQLMEHPQQTNGNYCKISVALVNGNTHFYELRNKDHLRNNLGRWYTVDPDQANILYHLVNHIEGD